MMESESIIGIYSYLAEKRVNVPSAYYISYIFDEKGLIDNDLCWKTYRQIGFSHESESIVSHDRLGPFESMEGLNQFIYTICQEMDAGTACLVSIADYNKIMEEQMGSTTQIFQNFLDQGNCIENVDRKRNIGLLNKIFRP